MIDPIYNRINKKLDNLQHKEIHNGNTSTAKHTIYKSIVNLTQTQFSNFQIYTLQLGLEYAIERNLKLYLNTLTVETENAIRHLDVQLQNTFRHLAY